MGFFDTLRRVLSGAGERPDLPAAAADRRSVAGQDPDRDDAEGDSEATTPGPDVYDRLHWHKKLKRVLGELPATQPEWADLMAEARALGFDAPWVEQCQLEEFQMLVRRAVSDRHVTEDEHRKIDLARDLIGLSEAKAEAILQAVVAEAETFFGGPVED
jgi:hypothetical protein